MQFKTELPALLKEYHEIDELMLFVNFQFLADYIELELAQITSYRSNLTKLQKLYRRWMPYNIQKLFFKRDGAAGIKEIQFQIKHTTHKESKNNLKKIIELYKWWSSVRPNRIDGFRQSGLDKFHRDMREKYPEMLSFKLHMILAGFDDKQDVEEKDIKKYHMLLDKMTKIDDKHDQEDTNMLITLIKLRHYLWT
jgi:hypothetical protein